MRNIKHIFIAAGFGMALMAGGSGQALAQATASSTFTANATLQSAVSVSCGTNLNFGTIARAGTYGGGNTIQIAAASGGTATGSAGLTVLSGNAAGVCTVTGETGTNATAALSGASGSWSSPDLTGVVLAGLTTPAETMSATLTLSKVSGIGNEALYIGGTLTVPASGTASNQVYQSADVTITVTE